MVYAKRQSQRFKKKLSETDKNKSKFRLNDDENDFHVTVSSVYNKVKTQAGRFEADHELKNWLVTEERKK